MNRMALITLVIAALAASVGFLWRRIRALDYLRRHGIAANGELLSASDSEDGPWELLVRFVPNGADFAIEFVDFINVDACTAGPAVGSTVRVIYLEADPARARLAGAIRHLTTIAGARGASVVLLTVLLRRFLRLFLRQLLGVESRIFALDATPLDARSPNRPNQ